MKENLLTKGFVLSILIFFAVILFAYFSRGILAPFIISSFLAYLLSPLVTKIMLIGVKRWVAVIILIIVFCIFVMFTIIFVIPIINNDIDIFVKKMPEYIAYIKNLLINIQSYFDRFVPFIKKYNIIDNITVKVTTFVTNEVTKIPKHLMSIVSVFSIIFLVPVITFFMLLGYNKTTKSIVNLVPAKYVEIVLSIFHEIDSVMGKYIRGQIIEIIFVGTFSIVGLSILGVNYAFLIGIVAGLCNLIPYLGPAVGLITAVIVVAVQFQSMLVVIKVICLFLIIQQIDNNVVQPIVVGQNVNLSPVVMMFALLAGAEIFGFLGILLAVPIMALLKNVFVMFIKRYKKIY
ncbi:MAG: AI-2E family transporter [Endomicrobiia bacterium]|nr:AI-2E family transporter [Endomicrobiaceae bacterium]MDD3052977.1 AI-2E family transporter [Endomicrobiaceae bacterium]MDD3921972.1 AI-2E family transporter [Endomicrobiaceae bacterium]